ncbi:hypothetical protein CCZ01_09365 [Helicobacter monodelphidis]|uniref:hypothetical protein n=1 Tax=Helicobacter sp. 15-1451 TaxID=2004995 RepID=UPI000DCBD9F6|nr:hypothetical protein [Helicobacter sp. 15-1451]RAX56493.1 hypothetical protein CCZ01_09365 [Helicobacter sp. 15-1451]
MKLKVMDFQGKQPPKNKNIFIIVGALCIFLCVILLFIFVGDDESSQELIPDPLVQKEESQPSMLDNPFDETKIAQMSSQQNITQVDQNKTMQESQEMNITSDILTQSTLQESSIDLNAFESKEVKKQKPENMITYLKNIQSNISLHGNSFRYENIYYYANDKFEGWWKIEKITPLFIRFKDANYSYNLRFVGEE